MELPLAESTKDCAIFSCLLTKTGAVFFTYSKMLAGALNFFGGIIFLYKFWKSKSFYSNDQTSSNERDRRTNKVAIVVITLEIVLNFIPQVGAALVYQVFGIVPGAYLGPYNFSLTATDAIISSSLIYSTTFKSKHKTQVIQMSSGNRRQSTTRN
ncbi:serpentine type 7TM GPCR chemoreceptor srbc domain-containing protein [Ditylenchus destructor]|nr:serpentine type 7TM GPCR chemoreceptor srbc domain-containing protein [Ditylenchus destructor]